MTTTAEAIQGLSANVSNNAASTWPSGASTTLEPSSSITFSSGIGARYNPKPDTCAREAVSALTVGRFSQLNVGTASMPLTLSASAAIVDENEINRVRKKEYADTYGPALVDAIREQPFEAGVLSAPDYLVREMLEKNELAAKDFLEELFIDTLAKGRLEIACGVMELVGRLDEATISPTGKLMAIAALKCRNIRLQEAGIRAFENWSSPECVAILEHIEFASEWLQEYAQRIIATVMVA